MSHIHQGPLATYNSLTDGHLSGYFSNGRMRRHLRKAGLVSKQGEIVSESTYRLNMSRKEHKKQVKDMLAQAIVHKTLDLERTRQAEIKKKLEEISKIQLVRRVRDDRTKVFEETVLPLLSPRNGQGQTILSARLKRTPRTQSTHSVSVTHDRASTGRKGDEDILPYLTPRSQRPGSSPAYKHSGGQASQSKLRPNSAPGVRSESRHSQISVEEEGDVLYLDDDGRPITPANVEHGLSGEQSHIDSRHLHTLDTAAIRKYAMLMSQMEEGHGVTSPYMMSQVPLPPKARLTNRSLLSSRRVQSASACPKRAVTTTDSRIARLHRPEAAKAHAGDLQSMCRVLMKYHGWALNLAREKMDPTQEVVVEQQHCGGNTLTVFKERLTPGTTFEFISYRHRGYPFSLTLYLDGQMDSRVSTCCEYRHSRGAKIGGKQGHFSLLSVEGAIPCYKCQVAKGVLVRGKATPRKAKRPSEKHMEEVIVVATKKDDDQDDDHDTEWRTKQAKPVGEEDRAVMIAVEGDDDDHGDKTPKSPADKDTTYDDDFDDSKSSASSRSSSVSGSDSETESSARQRDEDYKCSGVRNKERGQEEPAEEVETQPHSAGTHSSRLKSASHRRPPPRDSSQDQSPERAVYTDTVTPRRSRSPSPHFSPPPPPPRKWRGKNRAKAVADVVSAPPRENREDADVQETKPTKGDKESREYPREVKGEKHSRHMKEEADTADEVSEIESEIVSPRKLEAGGTEEEKNTSFTSQPKSALSDLPEEGDSIHEEIEPCRGEDDTLKQDVDADSLESRGDEEREMRMHPTIKLASSKEAVKRKGLRNENRSKSHALSSPERTPRSPKSASSQVVQGMELSDPSSQSSSGEDDCSESCVSQSWASQSETYTKLMQRDERAFPCEEQGPVNGYTLSSSKDNIIKRSKAKKKRRKTTSPRSAPGIDKAGHVVEVEQPVKIPSISVGAPASYDTTGGGKHQLEIVIGTEPSSRQFLQDDIYVLQSTSQPDDDNAREPTGDNNEKSVQDSAHVPAIVVSSVPQVTIDFSPVPSKNIPERIPCTEAGMNERGCEEMSQGEESETEVRRSTDNIPNTAESENKGTELYMTESSNNRKDNAEECDRTTDREVCERREDGVINIICQEPDSPPANQADTEISISKVRRLSVELGTDTENVVLAHLRKLSPDAGNNDDDDAVFNRQALSADTSGDDTADGGKMIRRPRQSSLTVPLDAEALKLTERWVVDQDRPKQPVGYQKKTVTWTETEDKSKAQGDESRDVQSFRKEGEKQALTDTQAVMNGNAGEDGIRVYACGEDSNTVRESGDSSNNLSRNANENQDEEPPVVRNTEGNTEVLGAGKKPDTPNPSAKEDAENLYDDNDFEKEDDDSSSSSSSSSSSTWTSDSSNSSSSSDSGSSSSSASEAAPPARRSSAAMNLSMLAMSDMLQKNRHMKQMEPAKSISPSRQNSILSHKGPVSLSPIAGPVLESENETSDLDRSMTKETDTDNKTGDETVEKPAQIAKGDDNNETDKTVTMKTITDSHPTVLVSYPDDEVSNEKGQKLKQDVDDQGERSDVDSAYDAKMSSTSSLKGNITRLVEDIEVEEKGKGEKKEHFRPEETRGEDSEAMSPPPPAPPAEEERGAGGEPDRSQYVKVNNTNREIDDYSSDDNDEDPKAKVIDVANIEADNQRITHHRSRASSSSSSFSTAPTTTDNNNKPPAEEERGTDNTVVCVDLLDKEERGEEQAVRERERREEEKQKEEEELLQQQRHKREEKQAAQRRASEVLRQEEMFQQQLQEQERRKKDSRKKQEGEEKEHVQTQPDMENRAKQVTMVLERFDSEESDHGPRRNEEDRKAVNPVEAEQDMGEILDSYNRQLKNMEEGDSEEEESEVSREEKSGASQAESPRARSSSPASSLTSSASEDTVREELPAAQPTTQPEEDGQPPSKAGEVTYLGQKQTAEDDTEPPRAPSPFPSPAIYLDRRQTRTQEEAQPPRTESPPPTRPLSPVPPRSESVVSSPSPIVPNSSTPSEQPPRATSPVPSAPAVYQDRPKRQARASLSASEEPPRATSPFPSTPAVYMDRPKRRASREDSEDVARSQAEETSHFLAFSAVSTTVYSSDEEDSATGKANKQED